MLNQVEANTLIRERILSDDLLSAGKIGNSERIGLVQAFNGGIDDYGTENLHFNAGVYPPKLGVLYKFCEKYVESIRNVNVFAQWIPDVVGGFADVLIIYQLSPNSIRVNYSTLDPFYHETP